jgi:hypothetical protein
MIMEEHGSNKTFSQLNRRQGTCEQWVFNSGTGFGPPRLSNKLVYKKRIRDQSWRICNFQVPTKTEILARNMFLCKF